MASQCIIRYSTSVKPEPEGLQLHHELYRGGAKIVYHAKHNAMAEKNANYNLNAYETYDSIKHLEN